MLPRINPILFAGRDSWGARIQGFFQRMSKLLLATLLPLTILSRVACKLSESDESDSYSNLYPFLEKWAKTSHTKMLTVVFDDFQPSHPIDIPAGMLVDLNVSTRLVTLKHLISLPSKDRGRDYQTIETENCVLLLFSDVDHLKDILSSPHLISFWHPENFYILREQGQPSATSFEQERFCQWAFERLWRVRRVYKLLLFTGDKVIRYDPFDSHNNARYRASCDWNCDKSNEEGGFLLIERPNITEVSDFFEEERLDFNRYPLKISIFETSTISAKEGRYFGLDFKYLEEVCRKMNVSYALIKSKDRFGWKENGTFFGTIGHLVYGFADVSFNQFFVKDYQTRQLEFTASITSDKLCVLIPKAAPLPDYLVIVKIFTGRAWLLVFAAHFVIAMIYTILKTEKYRNMFEAVRKSGQAFFCCEYIPDSYFLEENGNGVVFNVVRETGERVSYEERERVSDRDTRYLHHIYKIPGFAFERFHRSERKKKIMTDYRIEF